MSEKIVIKNPLGQSANYGIYDNILLNTSENGQVIYSKLPKVTEEDNDQVLTVVNGFWNKKEAQATTPDWLQDDETAKNYIKNRPFYELFETVFNQEVVFEEVDSFNQALWAREITDPKEALEEGRVYRVLYGKKGKEKEYTCKCAYFNDSTYLPGLGNFDIKENGEPFIIIRANKGGPIEEESWLVFGLNIESVEDVYTCKITTASGDIKQIDPKFIPIPFFGKREDILYESPQQNLYFSYSFQDQFYIVVGYGAQLDTLIAAWAQNWEYTKVIFDGKEYSCKPELIEDTIKAVGNTPFFMGEESNNIPFLVGTIPKEITGMDTDLFAAVLIQEPQQLFNRFQNGNFPQFQEKDGCHIAEFEMDPLIMDATYLVTWNNSSYELQAKEYIIDGISCIGLGNTQLLNLGEENTNLEFFVYTKTLEGGEKVGTLVTTNISPYNFAAVTPPGYIHDCKISLINKQIVKISSEFIPNISWNKIFNKPFGVYPKDSVVLPKDTFSFSFYGEEGGTEIYLAPIGEINIFNVEYEIEIDGKKYTAVGEDNFLQVADGENVFAFGTQDGVTYIATNKPGDHQIQLTLKQEVIQKIDSKFIPDVRELPEVNQEDSGGFLRVSATGEWQVEKITNAENILF